MRLPVLAGSAALVLALLGTGCRTSPPFTFTQPESESIGKAQTLKSEVEQLARKAKDVKNPDPKALADVEEAYRLTKASHDGYVDLLRLQVETESKNVAALETKGKELQAKADAFVAAFKKLGAEPKGGAVVAIGALVLDWGIKLWQAYERERQAEKAAAKDRIKAELERMRFLDWSKV